MKNESEEKKRASNIIWDASADYSFDSEIKAYDESGEADLYLNYIIGAVHKYYDYSLLQDFFSDLKKDSSHESLEKLMWIGLENCTYEKAKSERPVLETLRRSYSKRALSTCNEASANYIFNEIEIAHFQKALGLEPKMTGSAFKILNDLEFDKSMNTEQIILKMNKIISVYFGFGFIPAHYGKKRKLHHHKMPALKFLKILPAAKYSSGINFEKKEHKQNYITSRLQKFIELRIKYQREHIKNYYGTSILPEPQIKSLEQSLCWGNHKNCHLYFTRGEFDMSAGADKDTVYHEKNALEQRNKNKKHYKENFAKNSSSISKLTNKIRNTMLLNLESSYNRSEAGKLAAGKIWRNIYLYDNKIFLKNLKDDIGNLSVDIMLDASTSVIYRQEIIAAEAYIIAESLTRCQIPVKVYSFCSERNYTIINLFRDYGEVTKNDKIFNYYSAGCNRDGLAIRTALYMMRNSTCEHKVLIILSDGVPNDAQGISAGRFNHIHYDYIGDPGVNDTALEVRKGQRDGVSILCVFTGLDEDIPDAKKIYGHNLVRIKSQERFADMVGIMIQNELKAM